MTFARKTFARKIFGRSDICPEDNCPERHFPGVKLARTTLTSRQMSLGANVVRANVTPGKYH
jgi:hypothetical protein